MIGCCFRFAVNHFSDAEWWQSEVEAWSSKLTALNHTIAREIEGFGGNSGNLFGNGYLQIKPRNSSIVTDLPILFNS